MSDNLYDLIPGFREAVEHETEQRELAFLELPTSICGVDVRPMTARDFLILCRIESPLVTGKVPNPEQLALFLWILSPDFRPRSPWRAYRFGRKCRKLPYTKAVKQCFAFVSDTFAEAPLGGDGTRSPASWCAGVIAALSGEFSMSRAEIMSMPLTQLWQLLKLARIRNNPQAPVFHPSDAVVSKWLTEVNEGRIKLPSAVQISEDFAI